MTSSTMFILMVIVHAGATLSMTKLQEFPSASECNRAAATVQAAIGRVENTENGCISSASLDAFRAANR